MYTPCHPQFKLCRNIICFIIFNNLEIMNDWSLNQILYRTRICPTISIKKHIVLTFKNY